MLVNDEQFEVLNALWFNSLYEKKILNSDGQQFHQYQQNEQLSLVITHWTQKKKITPYDVGNLRSWIETSQKCIYRLLCSIMYNMGECYKSLHCIENQIIIFHTSTWKHHTTTLQHKINRTYWYKG